MLNTFDRNLEILDRLETDYMRILYYDFEDDYRGNYKSYEYYRLCTIIDGEKNVKINHEEAITYNKDKFIILPPDSSVQMHMSKPTKALVFELNNDLLDTVSEKVNYEFDNDVVASRPTLFLGNGSNQLNNSIKRITDITNSRESNKEFLIDLYAQELTYNLLKINGLSNIISSKREDTVIGNILRYINNHLNEPLSIAELARANMMSSSSFSEYFKKMVGVCAKDYIKEQKMQKAAEMFQVSSLNVTEVSLNLGYENISYFIKLFKKRYQVTPKQFMSQLINK